ncbi:MAG: tetratricopeptide repeat protein [Xanthomonadales bacterium]|jgi:TolB-like protein/Flp pilus assembly protein TadD|nr:tetratricopeptide repeat protein [Xanthomonadales bacterium]
MNERHSFLSATLGELNRRKVLRTVGAYAVAVFVLLQLMDAAVEPLRLPDWLPTVVVLLAILGFPLVFMLAWYFDIGSDGIHRTRSAGLLSRSQSAILFSFMLLAMGGLGYGIFSYYSGVFEAQPVMTAGASRVFSAPENSIAVLPFTDMSEQSDQAYLADGVSEEILNLLAQVDGLNVAARTSSFAFRDSGGDIREIGRLLNVRTVLEGSVRTSGDRIRLTAQLINVEDGFHIWSKYYDSEMTDIFAIQDEVASNIATALVDSFDGLDTRSRSQTDSLAASQAYRTGRLHWWRRTPEELQRAIEMFANALEYDARFAPAYAAMADTWLLLSQYGNITTMKATEKAQAMIEKALAIDPESAEAFAALGLARWQIGQMDAAESALRHAVDLNEDYIPAQLWLAGVLGELGRYPEQSLVLEQAMVRDPLNELLLVNYTGNLSIRGEWERGRDMTAELLMLRPDSTILLRFMAKLELYNGNLVEGWKLADRAYQLQPDNPEDIASLARTWVMLGDVAEAERLLVEGMEAAPNNANLKNVHWMALMVSKRFEEAERFVHEMKADFGESIPEVMQRRFDFQLGMLAMIRGDFASARELLVSAVSEEDDPAWSGDEIMVLTLASLAFEQTGDSEQALSLLRDAERVIRRARLNGVDDPNIYFSEGVVLTLRNDLDGALRKFQQAYDRGFRELWVLEIDGRLDPLRDRPEFLLFKDRIVDDVGRALVEIRSLALATL